ncbi:MAG: nucleotide exchange factor GrpE [Anaerolineae bacterium]|nr:nucleotide exchange factor GrpE [Phycisphaerae bacterium]
MSRTPNNDDLDNEVGLDSAEAADESSPSLQDYDKVKAERDALFERLARAQADFQNSRKRLETESDQRLQYANSQLIKNLLPTIDNLERAMAVDVTKTDAASIIKGLQVLIDQLMKVLAVQNVEVIAPEVGSPFDPTRHEALMQQESQYPPNTVTQLLQKGYALRDRTLRPAQVAVSKAG